MRAKSFSIRRLFGIVATALLFNLSVALPGACQSLPINNFTIADGLAHNGITQIFQDKKGYLWVATGEGLSRYDGYAFKNYGNADGLGSPYVNDVTADRNGRLWVAINDGGIARFLDERSEAGGREKFISYPISDLPKAKNVGRIIFDRENRLWCATEGGVFRSRNIEVENNQFELVSPSGGGSVARAAFIDSRGRLWFGLNDRILKIENGALTYFDLEPGTHGFVSEIVQEAGGELFASTASGVYEFNDAESKWRRVPVALEQDQSINTIAPGGGGSIWIGTTAGLINYRDGHQKLYTKENGLAANSISVIYTDSRKRSLVRNEGRRDQSSNKQRHRKLFPAAAGKSVQGQRRR